MNRLNDLDPMPFGKHKGTPMQDVPASYLSWLKDQNCQHPGVRGYIDYAWSAIVQELPDHIENKSSR